MITGTKYFQSRLASEEYYKLQGLNRADVEVKIKSGEIKIGFFQLK